MISLEDADGFVVDAAVAYINAIILSDAYFEEHGEEIFIEDIEKLSNAVLLREELRKNYPASLLKEPEIHVWNPDPPLARQQNSPQVQHPLDGSPPQGTVFDLWRGDQ